MVTRKTPPEYGLSDGPIIVACQWNISSPTGPALHEVGGSFCRSLSSFCILFDAITPCVVEGLADLLLCFLLPFLRPPPHKNHSEPSSALPSPSPAAPSPSPSAAARGAGARRPDQVRRCRPEQVRRRLEEQVWRRRPEQVRRPLQVGRWRLGLRYQMRSNPSFAEALFPVASLDL